MLESSYHLDLILLNLSDYYLRIL